jgi:hypothetical protein
MTPNEIKAASGWPSDFTPTPQSSNIEAVKIQPSAEDPDVVQLQVIFKSRTRYHYGPLHRDMAEGILAPGVSAGKYLNQVIKPRCDQVPEAGELPSITQEVDIITGEVLTQEAGDDGGESQA